MRNYTLPVKSDLRLMAFSLVDNYDHCRKEPGVLLSGRIPGMETTELILGGCELIEDKKDILHFQIKLS